MADKIVEKDPYVGPRPFETKHRHLFFGRDREISELLSLVIAHRVLLVYAQSGAGKTSLINAGLIPLLQTEGFEILPVARVRGRLPDDLAVENVANVYALNTILSWEGREALPAMFARMSLDEYLKKISPEAEEDSAAPKLLIFDQFEELFTAYPERWQDRKIFFTQLAAALKENPFLRVLFIIREDYLAQLDPFAAVFSKKLNTRFRLEALGYDGALAAVTGPLANTGRGFAKGVAEKLVEELQKVPVLTAAQETEKVRGEYVEPVQLQVVCRRLWQQAESKKIKLIRESHIQAFGDVNEALSNYYHLCIRQTMEETNVSEGALRRWFGRNLVTPAGTRGMVYRGEQETSGMPNAAVDILERYYIIRGEWRGGARWYELTHDRFIEPIQLSNREWFNKLPDTEQTGQHFIARAQDWQRSGRSAEALLDEVELMEAERWQSSPELAGTELDATLEIYLQASRVHWDRKNAARRERSARRLRRFSIALLVMVVLTAAASFLAYKQWRRAEQKVRIAASRELAYYALENLNEDPQLSILLALEAVSEFYTRPENVTPEARLALHRVAQVPRFSLDIEIPAGASLNAVAFSPDGNYLASAGDDSTARIWNAYSGQLIHTLKEHNGLASDVAFSPDSRTLASGSWDGVIRIWDVQTGNLLRTMSGHGSKVLAIIYSGDGKQLASAGRDRQVKVWDTETGIELASLKDGDEWFTNVTFSPNRHLLAVAGSDGIGRVWNLTGDMGEPIYRLKGHSGSLNSIQFSPGGRWLVTTSEDSTARLWDPETGNEVRKISNPGGPVTDAVFLPDGKRLATVDRSGLMTVWNPSSGKQITRNVTFGSQLKGIAVGLGAQGVRLAAAGLDSSLRIWNEIRGELNPLIGHCGEVAGLSFSPDGSLLASTGEDRTVRVWEVATGDELLTLTGHEKMVWAVKFDPSGSQVVASGLDGRICFWDVNTGRQIQVIQCGTGAVRGIDFSPDGRWLAGACSDSSVHIWDAQTGSRVAVLRGHRHWVVDVAFSPDGRWLASASRDSTVKIWDTTDWLPLQTLRGHEGGVVAVAFHPSDLRLASTGEDKTIRIWDPQSGEELRELKGHTAWVWDVAFGSDGFWLASVGTDGSVLLWDYLMGGEPVRLSEQEQPLRAVAFSPRGEKLAVAGQDSLTRFYLLNFPELLENIMNRAIRALSPEETNKYLHTWQILPSVRAVEWFSEANKEAGSGRISSAQVDYEMAAEYLKIDPEETARRVAGRAYLRRGRALARGGNPAGATIMFRRAQNLNTDAAFNPDKEARRLAAANWVAEGRRLAENGNEDGAIFHFARARGFKPDLAIDPKTETERLAAPVILEQARQLARAGDVTNAIQKFERVQQLDESIKIDPAAEARQLASAPLLAEARRLARAQDRTGAIRMFNKAKRMNPDLKINPGQETDSLMIESIINQGRILARRGDIRGAIDAYHQAEHVNPRLITAAHWNSLCWWGSLWDQADKVMFACDRAISIDSTHGGRRDSRGVARALQGDYEGAIQDFEVFIRWINRQVYPNKAELIERRERWIDQLRQGTNPFGKAELEQMRVE